MRKPLNPKMAFDSWDYPGSPWKGPAGGRGGHAIDLSNAVFVPKAVAQDAAANAISASVAEFMAAHPKFHPAR